MQDQMYKLRDELDSLRARIEALERFRDKFQPAERPRKTSKPGICASTLASNWLRERGYEWQTQEELEAILRKNGPLRRELLRYIRGREPECSSESLKEVLNFLRSFAPHEHQSG